jgi:hypothetical protein
VTAFAYRRRDEDPEAGRMGWHSWRNRLGFRDPVASTIEWERRVRAEALPGEQIAAFEGLE